MQEKALEIAAVIFNLIAVILVVRQSIWNWPIAIVGVVLFAIVFYQEKLYADMGLQIVFLILSIYGWYNWANPNTNTSKNLPIKLIPGEYMTYLIIIGVATTFSTGFLLAKYTDADIPYIDSFTTVISLTAQWMLARKYLENWLLWIFVDFIYVFVYLYKDLYYTSILYGLFFGLAIWGYYSWKKSRQLSNA